jgi:DNA-binding transcriptional MerR regulator
LTVKLKGLPKNPRQEVLYSRQDLASRWHCHIETIKRWEARGLLKPIKVGHKFLRYRLSDIEDFERKGSK